MKIVAALVSAAVILLMTLGCISEGHYTLLAPLKGSDVRGSWIGYDEDDLFFTA